MTKDEAFLPQKLQLCLLCLKILAQQLSQFLSHKLNNASLSFCQQGGFPVSGFGFLCKFPLSHPPGRRLFNGWKYQQFLIFWKVWRQRRLLLAIGADQLIGESPVLGGCCHPAAATCVSENFSWGFQVLLTDQEVDGNWSGRGLRSAERGWPGPPLL